MISLPKAISPVQRGCGVCNHPLVPVLHCPSYWLAREGQNKDRIESLLRLAGTQSFALTRANPASSHKAIRSCPLSSVSD